MPCPLTTQDQHKGHFQEGMEPCIFLLCILVFVFVHACLSIYLVSLTLPSLLIILYAYLVSLVCLFFIHLFIHVLLKFLHQIIYFLIFCSHSSQLS